MDNKLLINHIKHINFKMASAFGSLVNADYPYVFKGLQQSQVPKYSETLQIKRLFGDDVQKGFKAAYKATIEALKDKDINFLKQNLENILTNNITLQDVQLINENSPIEINLYNLFCVLESQFVLTENNTKIMPFG